MYKGGFARCASAGGMGKSSALDTRRTVVTGAERREHTRRMHRSHSTCTFHRARPFAGRDDPSFPPPLRPPGAAGRSRSEPIASNRPRASSSLPETLAARTVARRIDDPLLQRVVKRQRSRKVVRLSEMSARCFGD